MPNARLLMADSLVELRVHPERLTEEIAAFLDEVWSSTPARRTRRPAKPASTRPARKSASPPQRSAAAARRTRTAAKA